MNSYSLIALIVGIAAAPAAAQTFPDKPIRIIVPFAPGGSTDLVGRIIADGAAEPLGQSVIIDNCTGAGGLIGTAAVARAAPDGYTLSQCTVRTCAISASLVKNNSGYDLTKDFAPIILIGGVMNVFVVTPAFPAKDVKDLVAMARARPGKITFGSGGVGNSPHMTVELLKYREGLTWCMCRTKARARRSLTLRVRQINMLVENEPAIISHVKSGKLRAIAVTGKQRSAQLTDIPTMLETGYDDFVVEAWFGLMAPARTPRAIIEKLNAAFNATLQNPRIRKRLDDVNVNIAGGSPEMFGAHMKLEFDKWASVIKANDITVE